VRERFEQGFTIERVAHDNVRVYNSLADEPMLLAAGAEPHALRAPLGRGITMQQPPLRAVEQKKQGMMV
jgi:hypothetical protein